MHENGLGMSSLVHAMRALMRRALAAGAVALAAAGAGGCAGSARTTVVAEVHGHAITRAMLDHWTHVTAIRDFRLTPLAPVPRWVLPDPPAYTRCVAHLELVAHRPAAPRPIPTAAQLKAQCRQQYAILRRQVLDSLITGEWLISEGEARGLRPPRSAFAQWFERLWRSELTTRARLGKYMAATGETLSDIRFRAKIKAYSTAIEGQYGLTLGAYRPRLERRYVRFLATLPEKWARMTSCRRGYVVPNCRQYRGPIPPRIELL